MDKKQLAAGTTIVPKLIGFISCFFFGYFAIGFLLHFLVYQNGAGVLVWGLRKISLKESIVGIPAVIGFFGAIGYLCRKKWGLYTVQFCLLWIGIFFLGQGILLVGNNGFFEAIAGIAYLAYGIGIIIFLCIVHFYTASHKSRYEQ